MGQGETIGKRKSGRKNIVENDKGLRRGKGFIFARGAGPLGPHVNPRRRRRPPYFDPLNGRRSPFPPPFRACLTAPFGGGVRPGMVAGKAFSSRFTKLWGITPSIQFHFLPSAALTYPEKNFQNFGSH